MVGTVGGAVASDPMTVRADLVCDVLVVGAGPAGAAAAIELARAGRSVVVADKAVFPRDKCCGDGLTTLALRELEHLGLEPGMVPDWYDVTAAWLRSPSGREVCVRLPDAGKAGQGGPACTPPIVVGATNPSGRGGSDGVRVR